MDTAKTVGYLNTLSAQAGSLRSVATSQSGTGIMINKASLLAAAELVAECVTELTKQIFGDEPQH